VSLVDLYGPQQQVVVEDGDGWEGNDRSDQSGHRGPLDIVEGLEDVDDFGHNKVGNEQLVGTGEELGCPSGEIGRVAGEMPDEDVGVEKGGH
jgi:hypothetical protein